MAPGLDGFDHRIGDRRAGQAAADRGIRVGREPVDLAVVADVKADHQSVVVDALGVDGVHCRAIGGVDCGDRGVIEEEARGRSRGGNVLTDDGPMVVDPEGHGGCAAVRYECRGETSVGKGERVDVPIRADDSPGGIDPEGHGGRRPIDVERVCHGGVGGLAVKLSRLPSLSMENPTTVPVLEIPLMLVPCPRASARAREESKFDELVAIRKAILMIVILSARTGEASEGDVSMAKRRQDDDCGLMVPVLLELLDPERMPPVNTTV